MSSRKTPRSVFWLGAFVASAPGLCLLCLALQLLSRHGRVGDPGITMDRLLGFALVFAGLPAFLTGGGVARLVAHRSAERSSVSLWRATTIGGLVMGFAGTGLAILVAVPIGGLPETSREWIPVSLVGFLPGTLTGVFIGGLVGANQKRHLPPREILS